MPGVCFPYILSCRTRLIFTGTCKYLSCRLKIYLILGRCCRSLHGHCYSVNVSSQNSCVEILMPTIMVLGDEFGGWWVMRVEPSWMELVFLWKRPHRAPSPLCHMRTPWEDAMNRKKILNQPCWCPDFELSTLGAHPFMSYRDRSSRFSKFTLCWKDCSNCPCCCTPKKRAIKVTDSLTLSSRVDS